MLQEFHFVNPDILTRLVFIYATSFYGSGLWNLQSQECEKLYVSWNVTIRQIFNLSRRTHRYLIEPVSMFQHLKVLLAARFVTFVRSLINCEKFNVKFLARLCLADQRTVVGKTTGWLSDICGVESKCLTSNDIKKSLKYFDIPEGQEWRAPLVRELIALRDGQIGLQGFTVEEIKFLLEDQCES